MANRTLAELMESLQADLTNKKIVDTANPAQEKHYLALLEKSYAEFLSTFDKYMNSAVIANHADVKKIKDQAGVLHEKIKGINNLLLLKG